MANKIYPFKIKPTDILIQNEGGGGMLMNDQFVSIVGNVIPDQQKLLDDQIDVNNVGVQTDVFSSGIFITNVESNPLPIEDLASKNFDSLDENVTESEVVVAQQNEPDELQLPVIIVSPTPSPSVPKPSPSPTPTPILLTPQEIEEGIYIANFLPATEEQEFDLFDTIPVTDIDVVKVLDEDPLYYEKDNNGKVPTTVYTTVGSKISTSKPYFGNNVIYLNQKTDWSCLATCLVILAQYKKLDFTENSFYTKPAKSFSNTNIGKKPYIVNPPSNNSFNFTVLQNKYKGKFKRDQVNLGSKSKVFEAYKLKLQELKQPIIIRIAGTKKRGRGHFVVLVGITNDGNLIVHNPGSIKIALKDTVVVVDKMLDKGEQSSGFNYDVIY